MEVGAGRHRILAFVSSLWQQSPTFLAPGTGFVKDNFSIDQGRWGGDSFWMIQVHHIYCALYFYLVAISGYSTLTLQLGFVPL